MSVYKEGFYIVDEIKKHSCPIYPDTCDFGAPVKKNDTMWNMAKQLGDWYGDKKTRKSAKYQTGVSVDIDITLVNEWSVSDKRLNMQQATQKYRLSYVSCTDGKCKGYDGYITIYEINNDGTLSI